MKLSIAGERSIRCALFVIAFLFIAQASYGAVSKPVLKWKYGGCYSSWCETGWYSSVAVADLDRDGSFEIIASAYSIVALNGSNGSLLWRTSSGHDRGDSGASSVGRTWPGIVVTDIDNDQQLEIVTAHGGGYVSVYDNRGFFKKGWPKRPTTSEIRGLNVADLDNDGTDEIIATGAVSGKVNTWIYEHSGGLRPGWPQLSNDSGYSYGVFNDNSWAADLNGNGSMEIIVPSDVHYVCAYQANGSQLPAHAKYEGKRWGQIGLWESPSIEQRGWGNCSSTRAERYRNNMAHGAAVVADVDKDGLMEVIVTGNMYDCAKGHPPGKYTPLFIFNADRSRFNKVGWDWREPAKNTGSPLSEDYWKIEHCQPNPVVADIDGDGLKEILFASYDGRVHSFWLNKTEHHNWPYSVTKNSEGYIRFASEPIVVDLDRDGKAEIIFTSWVEKKSSGSLRLGKLHMLDYRGNVLYEINLPQPKSSSIRWNGALAAPTIANIDGDQDFELVVNTVASGFVAYDLPGSAGAKVLWRTGRNKQYHEYFGLKSIVPWMSPLLLE